jgi:hypothetical protein
LNGFFHFQKQSFHPQLGCQRFQGQQSGKSVRTMLAFNNPLSHKWSQYLIGRVVRYREEKEEMEIPLMTDIFDV